MSARVLVFTKQAYYRPIADGLADLEGLPAASERRIWRLCSADQVASATMRRRGSGKTPGPAVYDDHVQRDSTADSAHPGLVDRHDGARGCQ